MDETELTRDVIQMIDWAVGLVFLVSHCVHRLRWALNVEFELGNQTPPESTNSLSSRRA